MSNPNLLVSPSVGQTWTDGRFPPNGVALLVDAKRLSLSDALHGREAWRRPGKRDRGRRIEVGSRVTPMGPAPAAKPRPSPPGRTWRAPLPRAPMFHAERDDVDLACDCCYRLYFLPTQFTHVAEPSPTKQITCPPDRDHTICGM
jgi:hypothetical protein